MSVYGSTLGHKCYTEFAPVPPFPDQNDRKGGS